MTTFVKLTDDDVRYCHHRDTQLLEQFNNDAEGLELNVLLDEGVHRHLHFRKPDTNSYSFHLVTFPGHLAISGDMGSYMFARIHDMFEFFTGYINTNYWAEKLQFGSGIPQQYIANHDEHIFRTWVLEDFWERSRDMDHEETQLWWGALRQWVFSDMTDLSSQEQCMDTLYHYVSTEYYQDIWELDWSRYDWHFEYCLAAIVAGIRTYRAHTAQTSSP